MLRFRAGPLAFGLLVPGCLSAQSPSAGPPVRFTGYLQARETYQHRVGLTASINRARLAAYGGVTPLLTWRIQGEFRWTPRPPDGVRGAASAPAVTTGLLLSQLQVRF